MDSTDLRKRIGPLNDLVPLLKQICKDYNLGIYNSHKISLFGYEDFNLGLSTDKGRFFIKIFARFRTLKECQNYINVINEALRAGIQTPNLYQSSQGYLYQTTIENIPIRLCVMQFIDENFFETGIKPTKKEQEEIVRQATLIDQINIKTPAIYDSWAITSFVKEYRRARPYLNSTDTTILDRLVSEFAKINPESLPQSFVHGDIRETNIMRDKDGKIYIIDFAVAQNYPRIIELAVLLGNILFDENQPENFPKAYEWTLSEYQKIIPLTKPELRTLPLFVKIAQAMQFIRATYEKVVEGNTSVENEHWLKIGKIGLNLTALG